MSEVPLHFTVALYLPRLSRFTHTVHNTLVYTTPPYRGPSLIRKRPPPYDPPTILSIGLQ
jgi:hypothetical protein